jgi:hypothetical protein
MPIAVIVTIRTREMGISAVIVKVRGTDVLDISTSKPLEQVYYVGEHSTLGICCHHFVVRCADLQCPVQLG